MKKTDNYSLPQWEKQDFIKMEDFNDAFGKTDAALKANADATATGLRAETAAGGAAATENVGGGGSTYQFHIEKMEVRDDQDVERVAQELYYMTEREKRSRGGGSL